MFVCVDLSIPPRPTWEIPALPEQGSHCFVTQGSFSEGVFAAYKPCSGIVENSEVPRDGYAGYAEEEEEEELGEYGAYLDEPRVSGGDDLPQYDQQTPGMVPASPCERGRQDPDDDEEEDDRGQEGDQADDEDRAVKRRAAPDRCDGRGPCLGPMIWQRPRLLRGT